MVGRIARYTTELRQARRMACRTSDFLRLLASTVLFHLGNRVSYFNSNRQRSLRCVCNGRCLTIEFRQQTGDILVLYEILGSRIYRAPYESLEHVNTVVDLGAHIGLATLYFATLFPQAKLISVEPMADNFALLTKNCVTNGVYPTFVNKCIGPSTGEVQLRRNASSHAHTIIQSPQQATQGSIRVEMLGMSELLAEHAIHEIDVLKVDIEGAEGDLFSQCQAWISKVRLIIIEVHPGIVSYAGVIHDITTRGFQYYPPGTFAPAYDVFLREDVAREAAQLGYTPR